MNGDTNLLERPRSRDSGAGSYLNGDEELKNFKDASSTTTGTFQTGAPIKPSLVKKAQQGARIIFAVFANADRLSSHATDALEQAVRRGDEWKAVPNATAQANARRLLSAMEAMGIVAVRIARAQDKGIGITFAQRDRRVYVECLNDGSVWASLLGAAPLPTVFELEENGVDFANFTRRIRAHLFPRTV